MSLETQSITITITAPTLTSPLDPEAKISAATGYISELLQPQLKETQHSLRQTLVILRYAPQLVFL